MRRECLRDRSDQRAAAGRARPQTRRDETGAWRAPGAPLRRSFRVSRRGPVLRQFTGKFTRISAEGYDEFLKALNVGFLLRKAATASTPVMEITEVDGTWSMKTSTTLKAMELKFKLGVPFDEETTDGRKCTTTVTMKGNQLITEQKAKEKGVQDVTAVRTFEDDKLTITMTMGGVSSTHVYKRD